MERDIRNHFAAHDHPTWLKTASGIRGVKVGNAIVAYREGPGLNGTRNYVVFGGANDKKMPCFTVGIDPTTRTSSLQRVRRGLDCFVRGTPESRDLVRVAVFLAKSRGAISIEVTDDSRIQCPERVELSALSFLTHGLTWYESIIPGLKCVDVPDIEEWRHRAKTNRWVDVVRGAEMYGIGHAMGELNTEGIDIEAPGSAMEVLSRAKLERTKCKWFSKYLTRLLFASGMDISLIGSHWVAPL